MSNHSTFDIAAFRALFPQFADVLTYPHLALNAQYAAAGMYISQTDSVYGGMAGDVLAYALQLLTCHLLVIADKAAGKHPTGFITGASEGDVSVSIAPPPMASGWRYWLANTTYGLQLWALLSAKAVGGWSVGGGPEGFALRKAGGF